MCETGAKKNFLEKKALNGIYCKVYVQLLTSYKKFHFEKKTRTWNTDKFWCQTNSSLKAIKNYFFLSVTKCFFLTNKKDSRKIHYYFREPFRLIGNRPFRLNPIGPLTESAVAAELRRQLPEYAMPLIYRLAAWPQLVNGKVATKRDSERAWI